MAVRSHRGKWQVDVTVAGKRAPRVSCDTKSEALRVEADFRAKLLSGVPPEQLALPGATVRAARSGTLGDLLTITHRTRWMGTKGEETALRNGDCWVQELGAEFQVSDVTPAAIADIVDSWAAGGSAPGTINRKLAALSVMMKTAEERGLIETTFKLPRKKEYEGRLRFYTDDEVESLVQHVSYDPQVARLFTVAVDTGMRLGELLGMIARDVDLTNNRIDLGATKGNKRRAVPMTDAVAVAIRAQLRNKMPHEQVWPDYINSRHLSRLIAAWKRERGLPASDEACFHTFRHTTCSRLMQRGVPINTVMTFMGHTRIETTMRYSHLAPNSLELARAALERTS